MKDLNSLKDTVLETIHELEDTIQENIDIIDDSKSNIPTPKEKIETINKEKEIKKVVEEKPKKDIIQDKTIQQNTDIEFYIKLRERIIILFEGLQSPEIVRIDEKLDLTIKFLEYTLSLLDEKLENS